jgi:hypothetical protein
MTRIVTSTYHYKRPLRKRKAVALAVPAILAIPGKRGREVAIPPATPANDDSQPPANDDRKSAIVIVRRRPGRFGDAPDMTPEEHRRVCDLAEALFRVRRATTE